MPKRVVSFVGSTRSASSTRASPILWGEPDGRRLGAEVHTHATFQGVQKHTSEGAGFDDGRNRPGLANNSWNFFRFVT